MSGIAQRLERGGMHALAYAAINPVIDHVTIGLVVDCDVFLQAARRTADPCQTPHQPKPVGKDRFRDNVMTGNGACQSTEDIGDPGALDLFADVKVAPDSKMPGTS